MRRRLGSAAGVVLAAALAGAPALGADDSGATRKTMQRVFAALATLLPASLDEERFGDPAQRDALQLAFEELARSSEALAHHGAERDEAFRLLSRSLADDAEQAASRFARGRQAEAAFRVGQLTQRCVGCHSRLPSARDFPLADKLLARAELTQLAPDERARLLVAVRRFGDALSVWEALFVDEAVPPAALDQGGTLIDYLTVAIRVEGDLARAERTLRTLAARADTPRYLRHRLLDWSGALAELRADPAAQQPFARATALAARSQGLAEFPLSGDGLVLDLQASALLQREVAARGAARVADAPDLELARSFWLLGVLEERTTAPDWFPQTEVYMEAALRSAPGSEVAERAFERIEESLLVDYGALRTADLPEAARLRLERLEPLTRGAPAAEGAKP